MPQVFTVKPDLYGVRWLPAMPDKQVAEQIRDSAATHHTQPRTTTFTDDPGLFSVFAVSWLLPADMVGVRQGEIVRK